MLGLTIAIASPALQLRLAIPLHTSSVAFGEEVLRQLEIGPAALFAAAGIGRVAAADLEVEEVLGGGDAVEVLRQDVLALAVALPAEVFHAAQPDGDVPLRVVPPVRVVRVERRLPVEDLVFVSGTVAYVGEGC